MRTSDRLAVYKKAGKVVGVLTLSMVLLTCGLLQCALVTALVVTGGRLTLDDTKPAEEPVKPLERHTVSMAYRNGETLRLCPVWRSKINEAPPPELAIAVSQYNMDKFMFDLGLPAPELKFDCANPDLIHKYWDGEDGELKSEVEVVPGREKVVRNALQGKIL